MSINYYSAYNLVFQSELFLPSFPGISSEGRTIDVSISYGSVNPKGLLQPLEQGLTYQAASRNFWLNIPYIARFLVSNGTQILIEPFEGVDEDSIRTFLLSTCLEVLLRQRQLTLIPGYALKLNHAGVAFAGTLGLGQSMLQGLFYKRGHLFLGGNFFVFNDSGILLPGSAQLEFWPAVMSALDFEVQSLKTIRPGIKKYIIPLHEQYYSNTLPLKVIYTWKMHQHTEISFSEIELINKPAYMQQLLQANSPFCSLQDKNTVLAESNFLDNLQIVTIHVPAKGLKLQQLVASVENDLVERGYCYV